MSPSKKFTPKKAPLPSASDDIFDAERIIKERSTADGTIEYFIKWRDYSASWNSWEPVENLIDPRLLEDWKVNKEEKKKKKRKTGGSVTPVKTIKNKKRRTSYVPRKSNHQSVSSSAGGYNNIEVNDQSMTEQLETNQEPEANKEPHSADDAQLESSFPHDESTLSANEEGDQSEAGLSFGPAESESPPSANAVLASELQLEPIGEPTVLYTLVNTNGFTVTLTEYLNGKFPYRQTQN